MQKQIPLSLLVGPIDGKDVRSRVFRRPIIPGGTFTVTFDCSDPRGYVLQLLRLLIFTDIYRHLLIFMNYCDNSKLDY